MKLNKEWKLISQTLSMKKQLNFLEEVMRIETNNPKQHKIYYIGAFFINLIHYKQQSEYLIGLFLILLLLFIEYLIYLFRLKEFKKKWIKNV